MTICQESGLAKLDQELASLRRQRKEKRHKADRDEADDNETAATAQTAAQPAPTGAPTIQWVNPAPSH